MNMQEAINAVLERQDLSGAEMESVMRLIMTGGATDSQIGGFLIGLRMKGESVEEIAAAAAVMRELATPVTVSRDHLVDTCGTGGDARGTFNISTASALVAAAAGARVAKHGNRSVTSRSGSADVLEAAGVNLNLSAEEVGRCIEQVGVGFMFAPLHHGAMKHAIGPRREMGVRTLFNVLGPLTNPAGAPNQVLGVFDDGLVEEMARVLQRLGARHVMVVHSQDGLDEISTGAATLVAELRDDEISIYELTPEVFDLSTTPIDALKVESAEQSLAMIRDVLAGQAGAAHDIVVLNAGAALYVAGVAPALPEGVERARRSIADGAAAAKLEELVRFTQSLARD
jgi:anthranilate phosphoribosyltransferase